MAPIIPLWFLFAVLVGIFALCARAARLEREEGLAPSTRRLAAAGVAALVVGAIAVYAMTLSAEPNAAGTDRSNDPKMAAVKTKLDAKEARLTELRKEVDDTQREADALALELGKKTSGPSRLELEQKRAERQLLALEIAFLVMLLGMGSMFFLGDPKTLFLKRRKTAEEGVTDPIDAMARATQAGRFEEALRAAATVDEAKLFGLELIDFLFMRGIAQIQHANQPGAAPLLKPKKALFEEAVKDLGKVVALAPNMGEAHYALGVAHFGSGAYAEGAAALARAGELTGSKTDTPDGLPITKARSACLVRDGERRLAEADADGAKRCFDEVMALGVFTKEIPAALMSHRLAAVLGDLRSGKNSEARSGIALVREARSSDGLDPDRKRLADVTCAVYEMLLWHKSEEHALIVQKAPALLESWQPKNLPEPDEQAADEYLFAAVEAEKLDPPAEVFRALYFLVAVAEARVVASLKKGGGALTADEVQRIARPLFRALQFEPRHREALAALGVLYYLCMPKARDKALEWLDASVAMGTSSKIARRLLDLDRSREQERRALLDEFRGAASRFLGDAMVDPKVRAALLEELGRFQDFRPVLVDLDHQAEIGHEAPTLAALKERVSYIQDVATNAEGRMPADSTRTLRAIRDEYDALVATIEHGATRVSELERRVMEEVGKMVLR